MKHINRIVENEFSDETNKSFEDIFLFGFGFLKIKIYSEFRGLNYPQLKQWDF